LLSGDLIGAWFQMLMINNFRESLETGTPSLIHDIQRTSQGFYAGITNVISNVEVDGEKVPRLCIEREFIFLTVDDGLVMILTQFPAVDRRGGVAAVEASQILESLRIVH
jgi:hypothetical protein